jgi:DNA-binding NtrC family response regulator
MATDYMIPPEVADLRAAQAVTPAQRRAYLLGLVDRARTEADPDERDACRSLVLEVVRDALGQHRHRVTAAARHLGVSRGLVHKLLREMA